MRVEQVVLVNDEDESIGSMEKIQAHEDGALHRAFSVFIFTSAGELLLQQRANEKYHCGGLWTNTCCGHPRPGESVLDAATRRLMEEMGFVSPLRHLYTFRYRALLKNDLIENEIDHVFAGTFDGVPRVNSAEAQAWRLSSQAAVSHSLTVDCESFTPWFRMAYPQVMSMFGGESCTQLSL